VKEPIKDHEGYFLRYSYIGKEFEYKSHFSKL